MKKKTKKKILRWLFGDIISVNIRLPKILLLYFLGIPIFAYFDVAFLGKTTFSGYVFICTLEWILVYIGYSFSAAQNKYGK